MDVLRAFLLTTPQVSLNRERRAIQLAGCDGTLIASITLSSHAFAPLNGTENLGADAMRREEIYRISMVAFGMLR